MMNGMTDLHQHLLWGLDDGPSDPETTFAMLHEAHEQQVRRIVATPHACPGLEPFPLEQYHERLSQAQQYCRDHRLDITLLPGAEIAWTYNTVSALRRQQVPTLAGTDYVLIELWHNVTWREIRSIADDLLRAGFTPVFAHVERYRCFLWQPEKAIELRDDLAVAYQLNASTLLDRRGLMTRSFVKRMLRAEALDAIASDAHNCAGRPQRMAEVRKALLECCTPEYAERLVNFQGVQA